MQWLKRNKRTVPIFGIGITWLLYALAGEFRRPVHFLLCAALSLIVFAGLRVAMDKLFKEESPPEENKTAKPLSKEETFLARLRELDEQIADVEISAKLKQITHLVQLAFDAVAKEPGKQKSFQKFIDYYLPTTISLMDKYVLLQQQKIGGENIGDGMMKIAGMLDGIIIALQKQLDSMFEADVIDITAEIRVMEKKLAAEGLSADEDFKEI